MVKRYIKMSMGPEMQTQSVAVPIKTVKTIVAAKGDMEDRVSVDAVISY